MYRVSVAIAECAHEMKLCLSILAGTGLIIRKKMLLLMTQGHLPSYWGINLLLKEEFISGRRYICFDFFF